MCGGDAEPAEIDRDGRCEVAGGLERVDRLERIAPVAVVLCRARGKLLGELLGGRHEAGTGVGTGCEFNRHGGISFPLVMPPWPERGPRPRGLHASVSRLSSRRRPARRW